jgi:NAD(P)-dependent dehydrogenase (short-subunit alcohol dehydrogenase family)
MEMDGKVAVVTGGASGIGAALTRRFAAAGAKVVIADLNVNAARALAGEIDGVAVACDVTKEADIQAVVAEAEKKAGAIDLFCSNAGVARGEPDHAASASNEIWQTCWDVHVMSHVYAARAVLPGMIARGDGYLLQMASAAGLLNQIGDAAYSATKHAAVGFAESLAITHGGQGIKVSVICPLYVATPLIGYADAAEAAELPSVLTPEQVADAVLEGVRRETFLILPHPEAATYIRHKATDTDRWIGAMRKLRSRIIDEIGTTRLEDMHRLV